MIFTEPVPCPSCGKKAKKLTQNFFSHDGEDYTGNLRILMDKSVIHTDEEGIFYRKDTRLVLWDGESYTHAAGYFCTNRCAISFANLGWQGLVDKKASELEQGACSNDR